MSAAIRDPLSRAAILRRAWPIILAGASVPLLGLVDTAVVGHYGTATSLAALALSTLLFNFLYWSFGFLRMATTGFVAQARGAGDGVEVRAAWLRALATGALLGAVLVLLQGPLAALFFRLMDPGGVLAAEGADYVRTRIWGAPAALALYGLCGVLIGLGRSGWLLAVQLVLNAGNALLDVWLAGHLRLGLAGIGLGTAIAEWASALFALGVVGRLLHDGGRSAWPDRRRLCDRRALGRMWAANGDILVRTLCLLGGFAWFARQGTALGATTLAANHLLLQLVAFCAFFLDGFAHVAEAQAGQAVGAGDRAGFRRAVRLGSELAALAALALAMGIVLGGPWLVGVLTALPAVAATAVAHLPWAGLYVLLSVAAFQLDGIFIGATGTRAMRNAALAALAVFVPLAAGARLLAGNAGLWAAMVACIVLRALALLPAYRRLDAGIGDRAGTPGAP